jgi:hypothetical protein
MLNNILKSIAIIWNRFGAAIVVSIIFALVILLGFFLFETSRECTIYNQQEFVESVSKKGVTESEQPIDANKYYTDGRVDVALMPKIAESHNQQGSAADTAHSSWKEPENWWRSFRCSINATDSAVALFTLILAGFTVLLWMAGERQIRTIENLARAAVAAQRPWVKLDLHIASDLEDDGKGIRLGFTPELKVIGNSPANNIEIWVMMSCSRKGAAVRDAHEKIGVPKLDENIGFSAFPAPENYFVDDIYGRLLKSEIDDALVGAYAANHIDIFVAVSVIYRFVGGEGETRKTYRLIGPALMEQIDVKRLPILRLKMKLKPLSIMDVAV